MKISRSQALGLVVVFFLIVLLMWARYLRGVLGW
jgi:hypothetical protein